MSGYTATTFAPVQGFIEKSRKLRDLYGASLILSYLSRQITQVAENTTADITVISPGDPQATKGLPNRILLKGKLDEDSVRRALLDGWCHLLEQCRTWVEHRLPDYYYCWERDWELWRNHTWEIFWGTGDTITDAMHDLERRKLSRDWSAANWIGESSSLSGTDAIAWFGLGSAKRNPKYLRYSDEKEQIDGFYQQLSAVLEGKNRDETPEGKFLDTSERVSIPELVKRLVTHPQIAQQISPEFPTLDRTFSDVVRLPNPDTGTPGRWTGWFMGDGDKVGDHLKSLTQSGDGARQLQHFSEAMRQWGKQFEANFPNSLGRIIYAGGDDFLGVVYDGTPNLQVEELAESTQKLKTDAWAWLQTLPDEWDKHKQNIGLSVGFVWAGHSVPQRDILQHCREAEKRSKALGRSRLTLRVVFNSGQFVQWTCPWDYLCLLDSYRDRDGGKNWGHLYNDMAQLKARHAIETIPVLPDNTDNKPNADASIAIALANIYFQPNANHKILKAVEPGKMGDFLFDKKRRVHLTHSENPQAFINWFDELASMGWYLYR